MTYNTINDAVTMPGGEGTLLANRYRIVRQLGQGGMGSVWLAEDTQFDNKQFAIKMLPSILVSSERAYHQLKDEAHVAMKLTHPNIVTLRAFEKNSGNPFLVMDYIDGQTLDDYLAEKGKLSEDEAIKLLKPIAAALDYAHGEGVVHRDVKPANVMIRKDGHPFILDFGIAREIQETMTRVTGKLSSGTLLYMSPEQLHGASPKKEQDIYSFAAMAYECLSGNPPFSRGQIEYQIDNDMPEPLMPHLIISGHVAQGLSKKPEDRPPNCAAVLNGKGSRRDAEPQRGVGGQQATGTGSAPVRGVAWKIVAALTVMVLAVGWGCCWLCLENIRAEKECQAEKQAELRETEERARRNEKIRRENVERARQQAEERRKAEEAAEKCRRESAELEMVRKEISEKVKSAEQKAREAEKYRGDPVMFEKYLAALDGAAAKLKNISEPKTVAEANGILKSVNDADNIISSELDEMRNKLIKAKEARIAAEKAEARDRAKAIEDEIAMDIDPMLEKFEARGCIRARDALEAGTRQRNSGKAALKNGDYHAAEEYLAAAKDKLTKAALAAKKSMIKPHLDKANNCGSVGEWQRCVDECNIILNLDAANEEAKNLKYEAENHLAQRAEIREELVKKRWGVAEPPREQRQTYESVLANEFTIDDANTLSQLGPMLPLVRTHYERASEYAMKGSSHMSQAKSEYKKGRGYGGPEWPALEKWLKWWK